MSSRAESLYLCFESLNACNEPDGYRHMLQYRGTHIMHDGKHWIVQTSSKFRARTRDIVLQNDAATALAWVRNAR